MIHRLSTEQSSAAAPVGAHCLQTVRVAHFEPPCHGRKCQRDHRPGAEELVPVGDLDRRQVLG